MPRGPHHAPFDDSDWRRILAVGAIAGDLNVGVLSRYASVEVSTAEGALREGRAAGFIVDNRLEPTGAITLLAELTPDDVADVHAHIARHLMSQGPSRLLDAVAHARAAGNLVQFDELAALAEHSARTSLSIGDYDSARRLFELAEEIVYFDGPLQRARRLRDLATALFGLGRVPDARTALAQAFDLAEIEGDSALATQIAISYAMPADWYAGDLRASALLQRAEEMAPSTEDLVAIQAARAVVEMRIPIAPENSQQLAWVTRASIAQPLAEEALTRSDGCSESTRLLALLAWRSTHRSPQHLERRREVSREALDLSQTLRQPGRQVDAAVMLAADALESADRPQFDQALSVLTWIAERDGNPRLAWHAHTVAAGAAFIDGDVHAARGHRAEARAVGSAMEFPGWFGADLVFESQDALLHGDLEQISALLPDEGSVAMLNSLGKFVVAQGEALLGRHQDAERHLRAGLRQIDRESSVLLNLTLATTAALLLDVPDLIDHLTVQLSPWASHVAVDSNAWWCDGPVSLALAGLQHAQGQEANAWRHLLDAESTAHRMGDMRSLQRVAELRSHLEPEVAHAAISFTQREFTIMRLLVTGKSNREIAALLSYSPSTIRNDVSSIYRKFGVRTRAEAAAAAIGRGLV